MEEAEAALAETASPASRTASRRTLELMNLRARSLQPILLQDLFHFCFVGRKPRSIDHVAGVVGVQA